MVSVNCSFVSSSSSSSSSLLLLLLYLCCCNDNHHVVTAYFVPGDPLHTFNDGDVVKLMVNKLTSHTTLFPMDYYHLPYCREADGAVIENQNLGQYLSGDRIKSSPYLLRMRTDMYCEQLCISNLGRSEQSEGKRQSKFVNAIHQGYHNNWIVDNLPSGSIFENDEIEETRYWQGFPIGFIGVADRKAYVHNHVNIEIEYHALKDQTDGYRIVRFVVEPFSIAHEIGSAKQDNGTAVYIKNPIPSCYSNMRIPVHTNYDMIDSSGIKAQIASGDVLFTYDVIWKEHPNLNWASRWHMYVSMNNAIPARVHLMPIVGGVVIVLVLLALLTACVIHSVRRDIARSSNEIIGMDEQIRTPDTELQDEYGWKAIRSDIFRPPIFSPMLLAVGCGTGAQLLSTLFAISLSSYIGLVSSASRGYLLLGQLWLYAAFGCINGYVTAQFYKAFDGKNRYWTTTVAAVGFPSIAFIFVLIINIISSVKQSSYALPASAVLALVLMWILITLPLIFVGAYFGYELQGTIQYPVSTSSIPREIPYQRRFVSVPITAGISGFAPFLMIITEFYYIWSSAWQEYYYDGFGFLLFLLLLVIVVCAEINILLTYYQLCNEDYHWWWSSFWNGGSVAIFLFLYSVILTKANDLSAYVFYFGYMGVVSLAIFMMMGFVGVSSSLYFNMKLYASIKMD